MSLHAPVRQQLDSLAGSLALVRHGSLQLAGRTVWPDCPSLIDGAVDVDFTPHGNALCVTVGGGLLHLLPLQSGDYMLKVCRHP